MAIKGKYTRLLVGSATEAWEFTGVSNSLEVAIQNERLDTTAFQESGKTSIAGNNTGTITQAGYFNDVVAGEMEKEIYEAIAGTETLFVGALFGTGTDACPAYVARSTNASGLTLSADVSGLITLQGEWFAGTGIRRGVRVWGGTFSATGAQATPAYIDLGAAPAGGATGTAWLWVTTVTGTATSATITVQGDDNTGFSTPTTLGTFTFSSASGRAQEIALSGTIDRYLRLNCTSKGGATSFAVVGVVAVTGSTY